MSDPAAAADTLAALIDGLYIRAALDKPGSPELAAAHAISVLNRLTGADK